MNYCDTCPYTDGAVYTSLPPKCKCTITNNFHYFGDACDCEEARAKKVVDDIALAVEKKTGAPEDHIVINNFDSLLDNKAPTINYTISTATTKLSAAEIAYGVKREERPWDDMIAVSSTPCLICGADISTNIYDAHQAKICPECQKAVKFIKEKFKSEIEVYE